MQTIKTWKTITIGDENFKTEDQVIKHLTENNLIDIDNEGHEDWRLVASNYDDNFATFFKNNFIHLDRLKREVELVKFKPAQLFGFEDSREVNYKTICLHAGKIGLVPCSQEVPWRLRIDLRDTKLDSKLTVATKPFKHAQSLLTINNVVPSKGYGKGRMLGHTRYAGYSKFIFSSGDELVFMKK